MEVAQRVPSPRQRADVADLMEELSAFTYLLGRPTLAQLEIDAGLDHIYGAPSHPDAFVPLLGSSFAWAFGRTADLRVRDRAGTDAGPVLRKRMGDQEYTEFLKNAAHLREREMLRGPSEGDLADLRHHGYDLEQLRANTQGRLDFELDTQRVLRENQRWRKGRLRDLVSARDIEHEWSDMYVRQTMARKNLGMPHDLLSGSDLVSFWAAMPQVQVAISLKTRYHRNPQRPWKVNDIADIDAASIAYSYCDAIFTDSDVHAALKDSPDLRCISTYLPRTPRELANWLEDL